VRFVGLAFRAPDVTLASARTLAANGPIVSVFCGQGWGVVKSLGSDPCGPVGLLHAQKVRIKYKKAHWTKLRRISAKFCGRALTSRRLLFGEQRTSQLKYGKSALGPVADVGQVGAPITKVKGDWNDALGCGTCRFGNLRHAQIKKTARHRSGCRACPLQVRLIS
jgi:hypothetical protein